MNDAPIPDVKKYPEGKYSQGFWGIIRDYTKFLPALQAFKINKKKYFTQTVNEILFYLSQARRKENIFISRKVRQGEKSL